MRPGGRGMMDDETLAIFRAEADTLVESLEDGLLALRDRRGTGR